MSMLQKICDETTLHGFKELFYARSHLSKTFWFLVTISGCVMTVVQMHNIIEDYSQDPTKTQITLFSSNATLKYPPFEFLFEYFTDWIDLEKVKAFNFDLNSFFYYISHLYPLYTRRWFNITEAEKKLQKIMSENNISNWYDLGIALSIDSPSIILTNYNYDRYFDGHGRMHYMVKMDEKFYNSDEFLHSDQQTITVISSLIFEQTKFYHDFMATFNYSINEEYNLFRINNTQNTKVNNTNSYLIPFMFNAAGNKNTYGWIDVFLNNYEFYLTGTVYNWIPTSDKMCNVDKEARFYVQCRMICSNVYKLINANLCKIYFLDESNSSFLHTACKINSTALSKNIYLQGNDSYNKCIEECMSGCQKWFFEFNEVLYTNRPTQEQVKIISGIVNLVYKEKDSIFVITMLPTVTWNEALANIGGLLGLWLGGSIISFIQLIYIICWIPLEKRVMKKRIQIFQPKIYTITQSDQNQNQLRKTSKNKMEEYIKTETEVEELPQEIYVACLGEKMKKLQKDVNEIKQLVDNTFGSLKIRNINSTAVVPYTFIAIKRKSSI